MLKTYVFHYNGDMAHEGQESLEEGRWTYHTALLHVDGQRCKVDADTAELHNGKLLAEGYFEDGNELDVWLDELEEVKETV